MPLGVTPEQTTTFHLPGDSHLPEDERASFDAAFLTARQMLQREQLMREAVQIGDPEEALDKLFEALDGLIVGWRNLRDAEGRTVLMGRPAGPGQRPSPRQTFDPLLDVLSTGQLWDLYTFAIRAVRLSELDLGKSGSGSDSDSASSAAAAEPGPSPEQAA